MHTLKHTHAPTHTNTNNQFLCFAFTLQPHPPQHPPVSPSLFLSVVHQFSCSSSFFWAAVESRIWDGFDAVCLRRQLTTMIRMFIPHTSNPILNVLIRCVYVCVCVCVSVCVCGGSCTCSSHYTVMSKDVCVRTCATELRFLRSMCVYESKRQRKLLLLSQWCPNDPSDFSTLTPP